MKTDAQIQHDVQEELAWQPQIKPNEIGVAVSNHIVTLSGMVYNYLAKKQAEKAALQTAGVQGVANEIQIQLQNSTEKSDADLAEAAVRSLHWNTIVPDDKIKVSVDHGWISLLGELDWQYQKEEAVKAVSNLIGVRGVLNKLIVKSPVSVFDVKNKITSAFQRNASLESKDLKVEVIGNKVILSGMLPSFHDRETALETAWAAPGVNDVENNIIVAEPILEEFE